MFYPQEGWTTGLSEVKFVDLGEKISHKVSLTNTSTPLINRDKKKKSSANGLQRREFGGCQSEFPMRRQGSMELLRDMERK